MAAAEARSTRSAQSYSSYSPMMRHTNSAVRSSRPQSAYTSRTASRTSTRSNPRTTINERPQLRVTSREDRRRQLGLMAQVRTVADNRRLSTFVLGSSVVLLIMSLGLTLVLRTQMTENAYSITETQTTVSQLTQDVQQDRAKLNSLEAELPERATSMGMQQGSDSMTIDMGNAQ